MTKYRVRFWDGAMPGQRVSDPILPTPRLLAEGHRRVEAYEATPGTPEHLPVWRVRDDAYDQPEQAYHRVTVEAIPNIWKCYDCGKSWVSIDETGPEYWAYINHTCADVSASTQADSVWDRLVDQAVAKGEITLREESD